MEDIPQLAIPVQTPVTNSEAEQVQLVIPQQSSQASAIKSQSQSPISVSGSDSAVGVSTAITPLAGIISNPSGPSLSINQVFSEHTEKEKVTTTTVVAPTAVVPALTAEDPDKMDVDEEVKDIAVEYTEESLRLKKLQELEETLEAMENTRLELVPLLLDTIEQVKNGELSIKDVDNACGRIRVRINRLQESRTLVKNELSVMEEDSNGTKRTQQETEQSIKIKNDVISSIIGVIRSRQQQSV